MPELLETGESQGESPDPYLAHFTSLRPNILAKRLAEYYHSILEASPLIKCVEMSFSMGSHVLATYS